MFYIVVAIEEGVVFPISFSACLSFEYKQATDLLKLILYLATLLKLFISCRISLTKILGSLKYTIISSANCDSPLEDLSKMLLTAEPSL